MELGAFSISLAVKDIEASRSFYEKFGFQVFARDAARNWLILKDGAHAIGLFQGMFEKNILTFNPGWDQSARKIASFTDVRELQRRLKAQGVRLQRQADESTTGPASFVAVDPDGNPILVDQHVWAGWLRPRDWTMTLLGAGHPTPPHMPTQGHNPSVFFFWKPAVSWYDAAGG